MLALLHVFCSAAAAVVINTGLLLFGSTGIFPVDESSMGTSETVQSTGRLFDPSLSWKVLSFVRGQMSWIDQQIVLIL